MNRLKARMRLRMRNVFAGPSVFKYTNKCAGGRPLCSSNGFVNKKIFMRWFFFRFHLLFCFRNMQAYTVVIAVVIAIIFYLPQLLCLCIDFYLIFFFFNFLCVLLFVCFVVVVVFRLFYLFVRRFLLKRKQIRNYIN